MTDWLHRAASFDRRYPLATEENESGLRGFLAQRLVDQVAAVEVAPLAAELMTTFTEDRRHQRILDELLLALNRLMADPVTLGAIRRKIRAELPTLLNSIVQTSFC